MIRKITTAFPLLLGVAGLIGVGAYAANRSAVRPGHQATVTTPGSTVIVTPMGPSAFKVTHLPASEGVSFLPSKSVVAQPADSLVQSAMYADRVELFSPDATIRIDKATGKVSLYTPEGVLLIEEAEVDNASPDSKSISFLNAGAQNFYGGGERGHSLRLNGDSLSMYNRQNYGYTAGDPRISQMGISVPYVVSDRGYGILFDDHAKAALTLGADTLRYVSETPYGVSYYLLTGRDTNSLDALTSDLTTLTGRQPLPPLWTLGYITSKYGYKTEAETREVVDRLKKGGYPLDGVVLDLYWYGVEEDMGRLEWNPEQWPTHKEMLRDFADMGVNLVTISQPYINKGGAIDNYNLLSEQGLLVKDAEGKTHDVTTWVGDAGMFDVSNPQTREWLWNRLRSLTSEGIAGWWGDLGEPEVHPSTMVHANGMTAEQYHNVYGNDWSQLIYEGLRKDFPQMRPMLMMRGGTAGLQRYGVFPWTTDVSRSWGGFQPQVNLMLSAGLSGLGYMSSDIGGFAVDPANPVDPELYVRWLQMGTFTPMLRTHSTVDAEPYHYPAQEKILKRFIDMRYEWLPYNYTLAYENAAYGYPLARPLNFRGDNPQDKYASVSDEYLWGDNVLVAPVMVKGARSRKVLFPTGSWVDWYNPSKSYKGGTSATVSAPLDRLPLFVRAGSFIPQFEEKIENVSQYDPSRLIIIYFPSKEETSYTLFDDNRLSPNSLEEGAYQLTTFTGCSSATETEISIESNGGSYEGMPAYRRLDFVITDRAKAPKSVEASNGISIPRIATKAEYEKSNVGWYYDASAKRLLVRIPWEYEELTLRIK